MGDTNTDPWVSAEKRSSPLAKGLEAIKLGKASAFRSGLCDAGYTKSTGLT